MILIYWVLGLYARTWQVKLSDSIVKALRDGDPLAFWHGLLGILACRLPTSNAVALVSSSSDGSILAGFLAYRHFRIIRGSSRNGGKEAQRRAVEYGKRGASLLYAVDGSTGPKGIPKFGCFALARHLGRPVHVVLVRCDRYWQLSTWDDFVVPKPWARIDIWTVQITNLSDLQESQVAMMNHRHVSRFPLVD